MSDTAYRLGRPEWAQDDEAAACSAAGLDFQANNGGEAKQAASLRAEWAAAAAYYWAASYVALEEGDYRVMRENARIAKEAEQAASPEGSLLASIFGGCEKRPAERTVLIGRKLPADQVQAAKSAVQAEMARHTAAESQVAAQRVAAARADRKATDTATANARAAEVAGKLAVGQTYTASLPYRLGKKSDGLCWVAGVLVAVPGVNDGQTVRITALRVGRSYGLKYEAEGEIV